jgi:hypothetical protein
MGVNAIWVEELQKEGQKDPRKLTLRTLVLKKKAEASGEYDGAAAMP